MKKKVLITVVSVLVLVALAFTLVGCASGTYYLEVLGQLSEDSYIKLGAFGSIEAKFGSIEYKAGEYKYISEKNDNGTTTIKVYAKESGKDSAIPFGIINEDGSIGVSGIFSFKKK